MREHPIPQDITGYRFHIIGNMTLKQFAQLGVGCFIGFLFYTTNLIDIIKWPLIGLSIGTGALIAFVPFEERPLDHWLFTFFSILYKPTKFYWKKEAKIPEIFEFKPSVTDKNLEEEFDLSPIRKQRIREYLASTKYGAIAETDDYLAWQNTRIQGIMETFSQVRTGTISVSNTDTKPNLKVTVRGLGQSQQAHYNWSDNQSVQEHATTTTFEENMYYQSPESTPINMRAAIPVEQVAQNITIPNQASVRVTEEQIQDESVQNPLTQSAQESDRAYVDVSQNQHMQSQQSLEATGEVTFNSSLPFPSPPTEPNKVVGMVLTPQNDLINDAIVEIKNEAGNTLRAVKTNALGQFFISTPLPIGNFVVVTEKDSMQFPPIQLTINNSVVKPIEIRST